MELELKDIKLCKRCHRKLKDIQSKQLGFGPICYEKYKNSKKHYLFDIEKGNNTMELNKDDIIKFYTLYSHYDVVSPNIGVIGDNKRFKQVVNAKCKLLKKENKDIFTNMNNTKCTIIIDDIEQTYIQIQTTEDLQNRKFSKFI